MTYIKGSLFVRRSLKEWYAINARNLPWRENPSVYGIWLSEIILQQTRMSTGIPKWHLFVNLFPTVNHLAAATEDQVLKAWEGLGYYRRARLLHKAAEIIQANQVFPDSYKEWIKIPGVGSYTAAAISSISKREAVATVDGNVQRVVARWAGIKAQVNTSQGSKLIHVVADSWLDKADPGTHNQAVMELGALVCKPNNPSCEVCPISKNCVSANQPSIWGVLPQKKTRFKKKQITLIWHIVRFENFIVFTRMPKDGVWGNLWVFPEIQPSERFVSLGPIIKPVTHLLTHRKIQAKFHFWHAPTKSSLLDYASQADGEIFAIHEIIKLAMPRLITKHLLCIIAPSD